MTTGWKGSVLDPSQETTLSAERKYQPSASAALATVKATTRRTWRQQPGMDLVEVDGDHHAHHQIELVRGDLPGGPESLQPGGQDLPVHEGENEHLDGSADGQEDAVVSRRPSHQHQQQREQEVELSQDDEVVELVVAGDRQIAEMAERGGPGLRGAVRKRKRK